MPSSQFPANPIDQQQYTDEFGSIWIYEGETQAWNVYGQFPQSPIVTATTDGLVTPQVYAKLQTLRDLQNKGVVFETVKLAGIKDALYYYFKSSDKMIRFIPESSNTLRIEVDKSRIYQTLYKQACPGGPGPAGYAGPVGDPGTTGATELYYEPVTASNTLRVSIITPTPLTATGEIPLPNGHVPDISVRLYVFTSGTPVYVDQLIGFTSHFAGAYGISSITALINEQFQCLASGGTNCPYPTDLNLVSIIGSGSVTGPIAEVLIDPTGKLPNRLGELTATNLDISTTLASFKFDQTTNLVTGGFYSLTGPWPATKPYAAKSRQKGPDGSIGVPGNCTVSVAKITLNTGSANNPLSDVRWDPVRNTIYTRSVEKNTISCASSYAFSPANATLVGQPDIKKLQLLSVEKTTSDCKNIGVYSFIPMAYTVSELELVSWDPQAGCTKQSAFTQSKFDWVADTDTGVCPGGLAWFSADGVRSVKYPYEIVVNNYTDTEECCAESFFYSPGVQDAPCTTPCPVAVTDPPTTQPPMTMPPTTPIPTTGTTQAPWVPPTTPRPPTTPFYPTTTTRPTTPPPTTGTTYQPTTSTTVTTTVTTTVGPTTTGTTKAPTTTTLPMPTWFNKSFDRNVTDLQDPCRICSGSIAGTGVLYGLNVTDRDSAAAAFPGRSDLDKLWSTWGTSGKHRTNPDYNNKTELVWSRSQNKFIDVQTAYTNTEQSAFYYHKNWAPRTSTDPGNYYINTAGNLEGDLDIGGLTLYSLNTEARASSQAVPAIIELTSIGFPWLNSPTASCAAGMAIIQTNTERARYMADNGSGNATPAFPPTPPPIDKQPFLKLKCAQESSYFTSYGGLLSFLTGNKRAPGSKAEWWTNPDFIARIKGAGTQWQIGSYIKKNAFIDKNGKAQDITIYHWAAFAKNDAPQWLAPVFEPKYEKLRTYWPEDQIAAGCIVDVANGSYIEAQWGNGIFGSSPGTGIGDRPHGMYVFRRAAAAKNFPYMPQPASVCLPGGYSNDKCTDAPKDEAGKHLDPGIQNLVGWVPSDNLIKTGKPKLTYETGVEAYLRSPVPATDHVISFSSSNRNGFSTGSNIIFNAQYPWVFVVPPSVLAGAKHYVNGQAGSAISSLEILSAVTIPVSVLMRYKSSISTIKFNDKFSAKYWNDPFNFYE